MLQLGKMSKTPGATKQRKRLGRGQGTGQGAQAGKGHKGQKARTGGSVRLGFEGGQMPLYRRVPKKGFNNIFRKQYAVINLSDLERVGISDVSIDTLKSAGALKSKYKMLKVLGNGDIKKAIKVKAHAMSASAKAKIEKAGGSVEMLS
jgi:large subunit ribosomal protein L15